ncbi:MAG: transposase, partial [Phycisphaerae bacterium]
MSDQSLPDIHVPSGWAKSVKSAVLHVISLARYAILSAGGWAASAINPRARLAAEIERLHAEVAMLREELRIKDCRMAAIPPHRRPHHAPVMRMAILELKSARGWNLAQTAKRFLVEPATITAWFKRVDEADPGALVQIVEPVNKFPQFVRHIVTRLKALCPSMGKASIARTLARAGLHLATTTIGRMLKAKPPKPVATKTATATEGEGNRVVTAKRPNHVWHVDLTVVPTGGFWTSWLPFALPQCWPFCWWLAVVIDHFSRRVMEIAIFRNQPDGRHIRQFLDKTIRANKVSPKYIICDKGGQFRCIGFKRWCRRRKIKPRFCAVGTHGGIAVIERFIRSMKDERLRKIMLPLRRKEFVSQCILYINWYNRVRPHSALSGRTPDERYRRIPSACRRPRFEPRT